MMYEKFEEWMIGKKFYNVYDYNDLGVIVGAKDEETVNVIYENDGPSWARFCNVVFVDSPEEKPSEEVGAQENSRINWEGSQVDWQVGQEVWCTILGKGVIDKISNEEDHPITVKFEGGKQTYTLQGEMFSIVECNRSLFFSEPIITAELFPPKKPFTPVLKKGDRVHIYTKGGLFPEGVVREVFSEAKDRIYISEDGHYFMKRDIESIHILGEEIKFQ